MARCKRLALPLLVIAAGWVLIATGAPIMGTLGTFLGLYLLGQSWAATS